MKLGSVRQAKVEARVELGRTELTVGDLATIGSGSIIKLERLAGEPVDFVVAGELVARGEVVVIDENFGIRLTELVEGGA
jgi:flagellar motor switch protein FliN/FliY